jgi:hypothetical protein
VAAATRSGHGFSSGESPNHFKAFRKKRLAPAARRTPSGIPTRAAFSASAG